jgi:hypothetical protein
VGFGVGEGFWWCGGVLRVGSGGGVGVGGWFYFQVF